MQTAFISILGLYLVATLFYLLRLVTGKPVLSALGLRVTLVDVGKNKEFTASLKKWQEDLAGK